MAKKIVPEYGIDWDPFEAFVIEFRNESDRAAVILGAAKLDLIMYQILKAYLIPTASGKDELLDGESPLGTFSSKINILHRLGILKPDFARSLHLVRRIRNAFAHEVSGCALDSGAHNDRVKELALPFRHLNFFGRFKTHFFKDEVGPSVDFRAVLAIMVGRLEALLITIDSVNDDEAWGLISKRWLEEDESSSNKSLQPTAESGG